MGINLPLKGARHPHFSAHIYCGETVGWIKMPLSTEVGLGPDDIVFAAELWLIGAIANVV